MRYHHNSLARCRSFIKKGDTARAIAELRRLVAAEPGLAAAWLELGDVLRRTRRFDDALAALHRAAEIEPENARIYRGLSAAHRAKGQEIEALATDLAATALESRSALALYNLATAYFMAGRNEPAATWYRLALTIDPDLVLAHQNLAAILETEGRAAEARHHRDQALARQCLFVEPAQAAIRTVLILAASGLGNVPIDFLFPQATTTRVKWFVDYALAGQADTLPPYDLVFNAIGDSDMAGPQPDEIARFLRRCARPLLNPPEMVAKTQRHLMPGLLAGIEHVVAPPTLRVGREETGAVAALAFPILLRPIGSHGGKGVVRVDTAEMLATVELDGAEAFYATAYRDYRSADGYYRKYRVIFVDRQPLPYHLAISESWLVHYFTADMLSPPWKREEERKFLEDPVAVLGARAMDAIAAIGRRLDLDFCGIDFSVLPDGRVLVFEANATMLIHLQDSLEEFPYKHVHVPKIFAAFDAMLARRLATA